MYKKSNFIRNNITSIIPPSVTDDATKGYVPGSKWIDVIGDNIYFCVDGNTGAAVWNQVDTNLGNTDLTQTDQFRSYTWSGNNPSKLYFKGANGNIVCEDSMNWAIWSGAEGASVAKFQFTHDGGQSRFGMQDGNSAIIATGTSVSMESHALTANEGFKISLSSSATLRAGNSTNRLDIGSNIITFDNFDSATKYGRIDNGKFLWGADEAIGTEIVSLQGYTLVKGLDDLVGTTGFRIENAAGDSSIDIKNDNTVVLADTAQVGEFSGAAMFAHKDNFSGPDFGIIQTAAGQTIVNSKAGQTLSLQQGNSDRLLISTSGDITIQQKLTATGKLDLVSTADFLHLNRLTTAERDLLTVTSGSEGAVIFNRSTKQPEYYNGTAWTSF